MPDLDDLASACSVTPLPACDPTHPIVVQEGQDCGADDAVTGNGQCDLPAGTYGMLVVHNRASVIFEGGTSVVCGIRAGKNIRLASSGAATILIPGRGNAYFNSSSSSSVPSSSSSSSLPSTSSSSSSTSTSLPDVTYRW